jgi:hypothetical protein
MAYPLSSNVSAGDPTLSAHYNNLRSDAINLGQPAADVVTLAAFLERFESRLTLERLSTDKIRVPASAAAPVSIMVAGFMVQAAANVDLADANKPSGAANSYYVFANRVAGSTTFTLTVNTSITEAANQRLLGRFYWDGTKIVKDSVRSELSVLVKSLLYFVEPQLCEGRLTIVTGVPVPTADVASSASVYFTPYIGSRIALYVENYGWRNYKFDELTLNISAVAADKNLDIWVYDNAGTLTLAMTEWSNDILRATALAYQDGVLVKSGAPAYRYLGTVRTFNAGVTRDTVTSRFVWNYYNRVDRHLLVNDATDSWTYTVATTWRALNTSANNRVTCVIGVDETIVKFSVYVMGSNSNTNPIAVGIGLDVTNNNTAKVLRNMGPTSAAVKYWLGADFCENPGIGYHFLQIVEYSGGNTTTFYGDNNLPGVVAAGGIGSICC